MCFTTSSGANSEEVGSVDAIGPTSSARRLATFLTIFTSGLTLKQFSELNSTNRYGCSGFNLEEKSKINKASHINSGRERSASENYDHTSAGRKE